MKWKPDLSTGWEKMINAARWDIKHNPFGTFTTKGADPDFNLLRCNILIKCLEEYYMKEILKEEVGRSLRSRGMALSLILGGIVSAAQVIQYQIPKYQWNMTRDLGAYPILYPSSVADSWIAGSPVYLENFLYFLIYNLNFYYILRLIILCSFLLVFLYFFLLLQILLFL